MGGGEMFSLPHAVGVVIARLSFMITYIFLCKRSAFFH
ncbi:putative membrane protein [Bacteroides fragilis str. 3397 N2]|nr:putative membrane protein [Bacteroides fragilis str. 3397 N2]